MTYLTLRVLAEKRAHEGLLDVAVRQGTMLCVVAFDVHLIRPTYLGS
jgi:hypothetical protein